MLTTTQLQYILAVDKWRHFGKAAKACHVSQPSLSMLLSKAEEELGLLLFDREKKPVVPTQAGQLVIDAARAAMRELARIDQVAQATRDEVAGPFSLGVIPTLSPYLVPRFLGRLIDAHPKLDLQIEEMKTADIVRRLHADELDAGLLAIPLEEQGLDELALFEEPFLFYGPENHALTRHRRLHQNQLDGSEMWLLNDGHCFRDQVVRFCSWRGKRHTVMKGVHLESGSFDTLRNLVRNGNGYTVFPSLYIETLSADERLINVRTFAEPVPARRVGLIFRRHYHKQTILKALQQAIVASLPPDLQAPGRKTRVLPVV